MYLEPAFACPIYRRILPCLADDAVKETRAAAYRVIRHLVVNSKSVSDLRAMGLDWYIVRSGAL